MRTQKILAGALAAAGLMVGLGTVPATAAAPAGSEALVLIVRSGVTPSSTDPGRTVGLECSPSPAGDHPEAASVCGSLASVVGDITALPDGRTLCPDIYIPVTATAEGVWDGRQISYQRTFANTCYMLRATGEVFHF